jgi:L-fucose isomerase-like protein
MSPRIGVLPLARPTFDVPFAEEMAAKAFATLEGAGLTLVGGRALLFDAAAAEAALQALAGEKLDLLLIMQVTFTDATMTVRIAQEARAPLAIWAFPEPRAGGRLRLNGFCGLNLAMHALGRAGHKAGWLYAAPDAPEAASDIAALARGGQGVAATRLPHGPRPDAESAAQADAALAALRGGRVGLIGEHPAGFDTCRYDPAALNHLVGLSVQPIPLTRVFDRAHKVDEAAVAATRASVGRAVGGLDEVDQPQLDRSLRVYRALEGIASDEGLKGLAVRCWPEMFTEYGCAACGPMGLMTGKGVPCACEADMYGTVTSLLLQEIAGEPAWLVDIVDMDEASDTGVFWHCGSAPLGMADPATPPRAQIHSNRRMPLLAEFTLKPGRITVARISQAKNEPRMVLAGAEVIRAPMSFTGTSGVVRFDREAGLVAAAMMEEGLEHHVAFAYGEHRPALRAAAARMGLPVVELA